MSLNHFLYLNNLVQQELFLDCEEIETQVVALRLVQVPQLGMAELRFPTCPVPPLSLDGVVAPGPLFPLTTPHPQQRQAAGVSRMVTDHYPLPSWTGPAM